MASGKVPRYLAGTEDTDRWTVDAVRARYRTHCRELKVHARDLMPRYANRDPHNLNETMRLIHAAIAAGDRAAVTIGIELIQEDRSLPWGMLLKSDMARALRQHAVLEETQKERLRRRFTDMLVRGYLPREYKQYAKLFRKIGLGVYRDAIAGADQSNSFIRRWSHYLLTDHAAPRSQPRLRQW